MTLNMTTQSCIIRLRNIVVPICLMIMQRHLFTCLISQKKFQNTVRYNMRCKKLITFYKFVYQNILSFAKVFIVIIFTKYYNEDSK